MTDGNSADLLAELNDKRRLWRWGPPLLIVAVALTAIGLSVQDPWITGSGFVALVAALPLWCVDLRRKTTVLFYELEQPVLPAIEKLHAALDQVTTSARIWLVEAQGSAQDRKRNAGATSLVRRSFIRPGESPPPLVKTNVRVFRLPAGRQQLYFFPDRVLVLDSGRYGAVSYSDLVCAADSTRFIALALTRNDPGMLTRSDPLFTRPSIPSVLF